MVNTRRASSTYCPWRRGPWWASYSRGMRLTSEAGGITTTVVDDAMQRSPVFVFDDARGARDSDCGSPNSLAPSKAAAEPPPAAGCAASSNTARQML